MTGAAPLDAIVRFQDPARLDALCRAVFSLALGDYRPITIIVVCQRFEPAELERVRHALAPLVTIAGDAGPQILNCPDATPTDARGALLKLGLSLARGRFVTVLDDDGLVYPEAHRLLIAELLASGAAIAFGGLLETTVSRDGLVPVTTGKRPVFQGDGLAGLPQDACPLHGFVLDRERIAPGHLVVDERLAGRAEHDLVRRLCAAYPSSDRLTDKIMGEYLARSLAPE